MNVGEIVDRVRSFAARHVVVTGGEPMIFSDVGELCAELRGAGLHVTVETAGTVWKDVAVDLASVSPKLANSTPWERENGRFALAHEKARINHEVIQKFIDTAPEMQIKFVVSGDGDLAEIREILGRVRGWKPEDVLLMPEGTDVAMLQSRAEWVSALCKREGFRYCPRLHVELYGNRKGT